MSAPIIIRTSDRGYFKRCRTLWDLTSKIRQNWEPVERYLAFDFGTAIHAGLQAYYEPSTWADRDAMRSNATEAFRASFAALQQKVKVGDVEFELRFEEQIKLGLGMLEFYFTWAPREDVNLVPKFVEIEFEVPIPGMENEAIYQGRIDLVVEMFLNGESVGYYIVDHKTTKQFGDTLWLSLDDQCSCVPVDSEILTRRGWRTHDQLVIGEEVLGYNIYTKQMEWTPLQNVHVYKDKPLVRSKSRSFDFTTTANHKWVKESPTWSSYNPKVRIEPLKNNQQQTWVTLAGTLDAPTNELTPDEASVIAWLICDGSFGTYARGDRAQISQKNYAKEVQGLLDRLPDSYTRIHDNNGTNQWHLSMAFFHALWTKAGLDMELNGAEQMLFGMSLKAREAFCGAALLAEATLGGLTRGWKQMSQNVGRNNDILRLAFFLNGGYPTVQKSSRFCEQFSVSNNRKWTRTIVTTPLEEHADVWCPQTKLGTWVMRQNRQIVITGNSYAWALRKSLGLDVRGVIYNQLRKEAPHPPNQLKNGGFSVNKMQNTTFEVYLRTLREHGIDPHHYRDMLLYLKHNPKEFCRRVTTRFSDRSLEIVEKRIIQEAREMINPDVQIYPSPSPMNCGGCRFFTPCLQIQEGSEPSFDMYERRS